MKKILTAQQIASLYNASPDTIQLYIDGYRLAGYRKGTYSIVWCEDSKNIIESLLNRRKRKASDSCLATKVSRLEKEVDELKNTIQVLTMELGIASTW